MPLFNSSSPFDADVENATDEMNTEENWALILDICDRAKQSSTSCKDCLRSIMKRLRHRVPHVAMQALTLLNACVKNCGHTFHLEIASRDFISECRSLISDKTHPKVAMQLKLYIKSWAENEFKSGASLSLIPSLYTSLKSEGHSFVSDEPKSKVVVSKDPNVVSSQEEEEDVAKAIALSLQEAEKKSKSQQSSSLYPTMSNAAVTSTASVKSREPRKVRALYDFEAVEDNELTFTAGEIVGVLDDSDVNWWKGVSWRGEGLFPANFVTSDLTTETTVASEPEVQAEDRVEQHTEPPRIDEETIDHTLVMIQNADPTGEITSDPPELSSLEGQCYNMTPLIDQELEKIDRQHSGLTELNGRLVESLQLYHSLMQELPSYSQPAIHNMPTYMSLSQMYGTQQPLSLGQIPSGIPAEVGPVTGSTQPPAAYYSQPQQYAVNSSYVAAGVVPPASTFNPSTMSQPYMTAGTNLPPQPSQLPPQSMYNGSNVPHQQMM